MYAIVGCTSHMFETTRGPFYRPKGPRSRWKQSRKAILSFCRVAHRTVRCTTGHPLFTVRCGSPSKISAVDRCRLGAVGAPDTVRCTPDSPVLPSDRWLGHASSADCVTDRWLTGQSGAPPDSPVNFSQTPSTNSRDRPVDQTPVHHRTVRCTQAAHSHGCTSQVFFFLYFLFFSSSLCF
jgi:hypothetical protein